MTKYIVVSFVVAASSIALVRPASAHTLWNDPAPRDDQDGYKPQGSAGFVLPCGVARKASQPVTKLKADSKRMVQWTETVPHPGCFLIEFAKSETDKFQMLSVYKHPNSTKSPVPYTTEVKLPAEPCTGCILRIRQVMLGGNGAACPPTNMTDMDPNLYYSCANITLEASGKGGGDAGAPDATGGTGGASGGEGGKGGAGGSNGAGGSDGTASGGADGKGGTTGAAGYDGTATGGTSASATGGTTASGSGGRGGSSGSGTGGSATSTSDGGGSPSGGCSTGGGAPRGCAPLALILLVLAGLFARQAPRRALAARRRGGGAGSPAMSASHRCGVCSRPPATASPRL